MCARLRSHRARRSRRCSACAQTPRSRRCRSTPSLPRAAFGSLASHKPPAFLEAGAASRRRPDWRCGGREGHRSHVESSCRSGLLSSRQHRFPADSGPRSGKHAEQMR
eukprot:6192782-Pleurochrysis_carterae.AAC.3